MTIQSATVRAQSAAVPATWDAFKAFLEQEWGAVETWGETEFSALASTTITLVKTFDAAAIAFVKAQSQAFLADIASGKMSLADAATAVLNGASAKGVTLLEGVATNALISLLATFVAGL